MTAPSPPRSRRAARAVAAYQSLRARQRRLELWLEHRYPKLYDARHAATGIGRALCPLLGPLLAVLIVLPIVALVALLGVEAPSIDLPSVDLPAIPFPDITEPGWLRAIGDVIAAVLSVIGPALKYLFLAAVVIVGVHRTREARRKRIAVEQVGRPELLRRLAVYAGCPRGRRPSAGCPHDRRCLGHAAGAGLTRASVRAGPSARSGQTILASRLR